MPGPWLIEISQKMFRNAVVNRKHVTDPAVNNQYMVMLQSQFILRYSATNFVNINAIEITEMCSLFNLFYLL